MLRVVEQLAGVAIPASAWETLVRWIEDSGYRLTGAWSFGSGTGHSAYIAAGFLPMDDHGPTSRWRPACGRGATRR